MSNDPNAARGVWRARAGFVYYASTADRLYEGTAQVPFETTPELKVPNYLQLDVKMKLATLMAGVDSPWGLGLTAILPYVSLWHVQNFVDPVTESGLGDAEFRLRQDVSQLLKTTSGPRLGATLGVVANTGRYLAAPGESTNFINGQVDANATGSREISIGRGVWWVLGDVDASWQAASRFMIYGNLQLRMPMGYAVDGFGWGSELRGSVGGRFTIIDKYLSVGASLDGNKRGTSTYIPAGGDGSRQQFPNGGGTGLFVTPTVSTNPWEWLGLSFSVRQPIYDDVIGQQLVQNTAYYVALSSSLAFGGTTAPPPTERKATTAIIGKPAQVPEIARLVVPGKLTIVDYWATWCAPCMKLGPKLEEYAKARGDVVVARVDATAWEKDDWAKYLPDAPGIPVLDIFGADGNLAMRLIGPDAEAFESHIAPVASSLGAPATLPGAATPVDRPSPVDRPGGAR